MRLRPYQTSGVAFLLAHDSALLADQMGLGKTIQAISAIADLASTGQISRVLVITPASLQTNWKAEFALWAPQIPLMQVLGDQEDRLASYRLPVMLQLATYDQIRIDAVKMKSSLLFDLVVIDEAQKIKNADSNTALSCRLIRRKRSWALTGTPLENSTSDISGVFRFLKPGLFAPSAFSPHITELIKPYVLRRRLLDVIPELPEVIDQTVPLELTKEQRVAYQTAEYAAGRIISNPDAPNTALLAIITRLKQICNYDEDTDSSVKLDALRTILEECDARNKKVLVFSQYVQTLDWLSHRISNAGVYHGGLSAVAKDEMISRFNATSSPAVLLVSLKAGGVGLNLQAASVVILFDRWWNPATESQAVARSHRMGQREPVLVYRFLVRDSVEERIQDLLENKVLLFDEHVNSLAVPPASESSVLRAILAPQ